MSVSENPEGLPDIEEILQRVEARLDGNVPLDSVQGRAEVIALAAAYREQQNIAATLHEGVQGYRRDVERMQKANEQMQRRIAELEAENARLREPMARYTKEGTLQPGWTPVDAGRLDELEQAESRIAELEAENALKTRMLTQVYDSEVFAVAGLTQRADQAESRLQAALEALHEIQRWTGVPDDVPDWRRRIYDEAEVALRPSASLTPLDPPM